MTKEYKKYALLLIVVAMGIIISYFSMPYFTGVLGACTIYILVRKQQKYLTHIKELKKPYAALLIIIEVILCCLIPAFLIVWLLINKLNDFNLDLSTYEDSLRHYTNLIRNKTGVDIFSLNNLSDVAGYLTKFGQIIFDQVETFVVNSFVLIFVLYFMLTGSEPMERYLYTILPFDEHNRVRVINEIDRMVKSNAIGVPLLGIVQGIFATIGYFIFGAPNPIFFGFLTCFATIIPLVGTALIWVPLVVYLMATGHIPGGIGLALFAIIGISNIDNYVRLLIQKRLASTHPLITVFGVIIGISIFGFWGIIIGPLFFSMFFLCFDIFKDQYIIGKQAENQS